MNKKGLITIGTLVVMMLATPFLGSTIISVRTSDQIYENTTNIPQKELGLVLGAAAYGDRLSDMLQDRVDTAIDLYNAGKISVLVMSGAPNEVEAMKKYAVGHGVPEGSIAEDITGLNTMASVENIVGLGHSVTIVSQKYHLPRALFIANAEGIDAVGMTADRHEYIKIQEFKTRELLATSKAILDIFILD